MVRQVIPLSLKQGDTSSEKARKGDKRKVKSKIISFKIEPWRKALMKRKGLTASHLRNFIKDFGKDEMPEDCIRSDDWQGLLRIIDASPALLLTGNINSGKSFLMQKTIEKSPQHVFQVVDTHHEYDKLPVVTTISRELTQSARILPPRQTDAAKAVFQMYKNIILAQPFPKNHILVIEEAGRYGDEAKQILMESRKFAKTVYISQEKAWDFCPHVKVWPYNKVDIKKLLKEGEK